MLRARIQDGVIAFGDGTAFFGRVVHGVASGRIRQYLGEVLRQSSILVLGSFLVIMGMVLALGLVVGIQGSYAARQVGAPSVAGAFSAIGDLREITPYAFGYMMSAKVSTGFVAEIGTMRITDEIDALEVMGINSVLYLCSTRLLATWLVLPFLYALAIIVAFVGSYVAVVVQIGQVSPGGYFELFWKFQSPQDYAFSAIKAMAMGTFVVLVGVYYGYRVRGGPVEVGTATARAMIVNLIGVHFIGIAGSQIFWGGTPRLPIGG
ncbi:ABC transporter permease [Patulibacter brassicae]|uniref:ABC transporter permease n=2 Tax=Bacteria TaxID=2 RepID=A0ABU4VQA2_9ACTN|nr:ABC transporter permease [Patulibacter brassicae]MDX8153259.1 ABC transporter permease [Patulibacter brassicae]